MTDRRSVVVAELLRRARRRPLPPTAEPHVVDRGRDLDDRAFYSACYAPFSALYLDPRGDVRACCMNSWQRLGNVADASLAEIWRGAAAEELRASLRARDLTRGCEQCARHVDLGQPEAAYLRAFDDRPVDDLHPPWPVRLDLALSNTCNLQCVMCNGDLSSAIRARREHRAPLLPAYRDSFFAELEAFLPHLEQVTFVGGEPFLARESLWVMERLVARGLHPECHVTTNGTQWSDRIATIVAALPMHVAVSVDGPRPTRWSVCGSGSTTPRSSRTWPASGRPPPLRARVCRSPSA